MPLPTARTTLTWLVFPALTVLVATTTIALLGTDLPRPIVSGSMLLATLALISALERVTPFRHDWNRRPEPLDLILLVGNRFIDVGVIAATLALITAVANRGIGPVQLWPEGWPIVLQALLGITLGEALRYAFHRVSHRPGLAWRIHRLHHEPERLYAFNGPRLHPGNQLWIAVANIVPMLLLGAALDVVVLTMVLTAFFVVFQHANIHLPFAGWNQIFATPDVHRLHHRRSPAHAGVNYGIVILLFDRLCGTYEPARLPPNLDEIGLSRVPRS